MAGIRVALAALLLAAMLLSPVQAVGATLLETFWATAFASSVAYFTGRAVALVASVTFVLCALLPFALLCRIGLPAYGSWSASAAALFSDMQTDSRLGVLQFLVPAVVATAMAWLLRHRPPRIRSRP